MNTYANALSKVGLLLLIGQVCLEESLDGAVTALRQAQQ